MNLFTCMALLMTRSTNLVLWIAAAIILVVLIARRRARKAKERV